MDLVFLHGFTGTPGSFRWVLEALPEPPPRLLAPVLVGHRTGPTEPCTFDEELERIAQLVEREGFRGAHLVGYSLGSRVALGLLLRDPSMFSGATLIGVHPGLDSEGARAQRRVADEGWCEILERQGLNAFIRAWATLPLWDTQRALGEEQLSAQERDRFSHTPSGLATALRSLGLAQMPAYAPRLYTLNLPINLVVGELDTKFTEVAVRMQRALPRATLFVAQNAGHNVLLERPDFLAQVLLDSARGKPAEPAP